MNRNRQAERRNARRHQRGIVLVLIVVAMTSVLGMAGLALDFGLAFLTKSRIQNALDAAALSGAKVLKATGSTAQAQADAQAAFNYYLAQLNRTGLQPIIEFSSTVAPSFQPGTTPSNFIRVRMPAGYTIPTYLTRVFANVGNTLTLSGSAVAGPIRVDDPTEFCNLTPIMVSAKREADGKVDTDCSDAAKYCYGYTIGQKIDLKLTDEAGPGNFNLLRLGGNGNDVVRENLAGAYNECQTLKPDVPTQPGVGSGPFKQGLNTRFDEPGANLNPTLYPPDINVRKTYPTYQAYKDAVAAGTVTHPAPLGVAGRRMIRVVFSDVTDGGFNGATKVPITGFGCFFLLAPADGSGNGKNDPVKISAEFTRDCPIPEGVRSNQPLNDASEFFKIVLYKDPDSRES